MVCCVCGYLPCLWVFGGYFLFGDGGVRLEVVASDLAMGMAMAMGMDFGGFFVFPSKLLCLGC